MCSDCYHLLAISGETKQYTKDGNKLLQYTNCIIYSMIMQRLKMVLETHEHNSIEASYTMFSKNI